MLNRTRLPRRLLTARNDKIKMIHQHKQLAEGRWFKFTLAEQLANVGSEVERTILWKNKPNPPLKTEDIGVGFLRDVSAPPNSLIRNRNKNNRDYSNKAFERALELLDLTVEDAKNKFRLKEILRLREALVDYFVFDNEFSSSDELWRKYFLPFNFVVRRNR